MANGEHKYNIVFHTDENGISESYSYIKDLYEKSKKSKDKRIKFNKINEYLEILRKYGVVIGEPYVKHIQNVEGLYELRPLRDRFFFIYEQEDKYVILNHFMKTTQKTPQREIKKALQLINERNNKNG